jgi:hypothetical protein
MCALGQEAKNATAAADALRLQSLIASSAANAGPSLRQLETNGLRKQLLALGYEMKPIPSDGNCLFSVSLLTKQKNRGEPLNPPNLPPPHWKPVSLK